MPASKLVEPLRGADAKVKRADENIRELNAVVRSFLDQTEFPTIFKQRMKDGTHVFSHGRTAVDDDISVRIGEVIHNLRSALDHTYYAVVLSHCVATRTRLLTPDEERATQFPICRKAVDYPGMRAGKIEPWVPADALALLDGFQPCNNPPADDYFTQIISDLNNRDKHRLLVTGWAQLDTPPAVFSNVRAQFEAGQEISPETEVYRQ